MNYLAVRALHHYSKEEGPYRVKAKQIYQQLRLDVVTVSCVLPLESNGNIAMVLFVTMALMAMLFLALYSCL